MIKLERTMEIEMSPTWWEVADLFWSMSDEEQALFFNKLGELDPVNLAMQLQYITDNSKLEPGGRAVMEQIGKYSQPYLIEGKIDVSKRTD